MAMTILTLNCGSSSAKYQVYDWDNKEVLANGVVERIGIEGSCITHKAKGNKVELESIKTKAVVEMLTKLKTGKKVLIVLPENDDVLYKSARNIEGVKVVTVNTLCVYDILNCDSFIVLKDAAKKIEEVYA